MIARLFSARGRCTRIEFAYIFGIAAICEGFPALGSSDLARSFDAADLYLILALITAPFAWVQVCAAIKRLQDLAWHWTAAVPMSLACFWPLWQVTRGEAPTAVRTFFMLLGAYTVLMAFLLATLPGRETEKPPVPAPSPEEEIVGVAGWLVAIDGRLKGEQYRLYPRHSRIGSDPHMEISLGAPGVAPEHAGIWFDAQSRQYSLAPVSGMVMAGRDSSLQPISGPRILRPYDRIRIGEATLIFVPLYGPYFRGNAAGPKF